MMQSELDKHFLFHIRRERERLMDRINQIDRLETNQTNQLPVERKEGEK